MVNLSQSNCNSSTPAASNLLQTSTTPQEKVTGDISQSQRPKGGQSFGSSNSMVSLLTILVMVQKQVQSVAPIVSATHLGNYYYPTRYNSNLKVKLGPLITSSNADRTILLSDYNAGINPSGANLNIFNQSSGLTFMAASLPSLTKLYGVYQTNPLDLFAVGQIVTGNTIPAQKYFALQGLGPVYTTVAQWSSDWVTCYGGDVMLVPNTNYLVWVTDTAFRVDPISRSTAYSRLVQLQDNFYNSIDYMPSNDVYQALLDPSFIIVIFRASDLQILSQPQNNTMQGYGPPHSGIMGAHLLVDNLHNNNFTYSSYCKGNGDAYTGMTVGISSDPAGINKIDIIQGQGVLLGVGHFDTTRYSMSSSLINVGTFNYIGFTFTDYRFRDMYWNIQASYFLVDKDTMLLVQEYTSPSLNWDNDNWFSIIWEPYASAGYFENNQIRLFVFDFNSRNLQSWKFQLDNCLTRTSGVCSLCYQNFYLNDTTSINNLCLPLPITTMPGSGPNLLTGKVTPCTIPNCTACTTDANVCTACNASLSLFLNSSSNTCDPIPQGFLSIQNNLIQCQVPYCANCSGNYAQCLSCASGFTLQANGTCLQGPGSVVVTVTPTQAGAFFNNTTSTFVPCSTPNCFTCTTSALVCEGCDPNSAFPHFVNGSCYGAAAKSELGVVSSFDLKNQIGYLNFSKPITIVSASTSSILNLTLKDQVNNINYDCSHLQCLLTLDPTNTSISLSFNISSIIVVKGMITIFMSNNTFIQSASSKNVFGYYPIIMNPVSVTKTISKMNEVTFAENLVDISNLVRFGFNFAGSLSNPFFGFLMDWMVNFIKLLALFEGPFLTYPAKVLYTSNSLSMNPLSISSPVQNYGTSDNCYLTQVDQLANLNCNILANAGMDIITVTTVLGVSLAVHLLLTFWIRKSQAARSSTLTAASSVGTIGSPQSDVKSQSSLAKVQRPQRGFWEKLQQTLLNAWGINFFLNKMNENQLGFLFYAVFQFRTSLGTTTASVGIFVSVMIIAYYLTFAVLAAIFARKIWNEVKLQKQRSAVGKASPSELQRLEADTAKSQQDEAPQAAEEQGEPEEESAEKDRLAPIVNDEAKFKKWCVLSFFFQEYRIPSTIVSLFDPLVQFVRYLLMALCVVAFYGNPYTQILTVLLIEASYLVYFYIFNARYSAIEVKASFLLETQVFIYLGVKFATLSPAMDENNRQTIYGLIMFADLVLMCLICLILAVFGAIYQINTLRVTLCSPEPKGSPDVEYKELNQQKDVDVDKPTPAKTPNKIGKFKMNITNNYPKFPKKTILQDKKLSNEKMDPESVALNKSKTKTASKN